MNEERLMIFNNYIKHLYGRRMADSYAGQKIKHVQHFLENCESVSKKGYKLYRKNYACLFIEPQVKTSICDFLSFFGVGYGKKQTKKAENIQPLEKLAVISSRNSELLNDFIFWIQEIREYSKHTLRIYRDSVKLFFEYSNEFNTEEARRFIRTLEMQGKSPQTIRMRATSLEKFGEWMKKPIKLSRPKFKRKLNTDNIPTDEEYEKLLKYLSDLKNKDYYFHIKILASTGARVSEFLQIQWEDILRGEVELKCKGNKYRRIYFSKQLQKEVIQYVRKNNKTGYVAVGKFGRITSRGFSSNLKQWAEKTGIDRSKMHPHAFRHFFAKKYLKKTKDIVQLADILGHSNIETTRVYLQKSHDEQRLDFNKNVNW